MRIAARFFLTLLLFTLHTESWGVSIYVSPQGSDSWSGSLTEPNSDGTDGPLATFEGAIARVSHLRAASDAEGVTVLVREGFYAPGKTVEMTPAISGTADNPTLFAAYPGEHPVLSGGKRIEGWEVCEVNGHPGWVANLPQTNNENMWFRELFVDGERRPRTRVPEEGLYTFVRPIDVTGETKWNNGSTGAEFEGDDIQDWKNLGDVEICALTRWIETRVPIREVDSENHLVRFTERSTFRLENTRKGQDRAARYYVENIFEALDKPGEWYLDRGEGKIYYLPKPGETMEDTRIIAPAVDQIFRVVGTEEEKVKHVSFEGLTFRHAEWEYPDGDPGSVQAAFEVPGALYFENAANCSLRDCVVEGVGTYAVEFGAGCENMEATYCAFRDLGAGGIKLSHKSKASRVTDCEMSAGGRIYHSGVGVWVGNSGDNEIVHNNIHDFYYTGVSVGWSWGYGPSDAVRNRVENNHIHNIGQGLLSDMGGIYTLGIAEGTRLAHNLIHDVSSHAYGGWGIYPDEGSTHILIENNIVYRTKTGGFHQHYGKENTVRNNVFGFAVVQQLQRSREEDHKSFDFVNNIVIFDRGKVFGSTWKNDNWFLDNNVYWSTEGEDFDFAGGTLDEWRERGHDVHSVIADPLFVDVDSDDFRLKPESPALELGFEPIDLSKVGPRPR